MPPLSLSLPLLLLLLGHAQTQGLVVSDSSAVGVFAGLVAKQTAGYYVAKANGQGAVTPNSARDGTGVQWYESGVLCTLLLMQGVLWSTTRQRTGAARGSPPLPPLWGWQAHPREASLAQTQTWLPRCWAAGTMTLCGTP